MTNTDPSGLTPPPAPIHARALLAEAILGWDQKANAFEFEVAILDNYHLHYPSAPGTRAARDRNADWAWRARNHANLLREAFASGDYSRHIPVPFGL